MKGNRRFVQESPAGGWEVRAPKAERASSTHSTQASAIERAREILSNTRPKPRTCSRWSTSFGCSAERSSRCRLATGAQYLRSSVRRRRRLIVTERLKAATEERLKTGHAVGAVSII
jgi:hypothetical protein